MKSKKKYRPEYCQIINKWRKSGLTRQEFCAQHNYNESTFIGWVKKLGSSLRVNSFSTGILVPLQIEQPQFVAPRCEFELRYPNGVCLGMSSLPAAEELSRIVHIYRSELCSR